MITYKLKINYQDEKVLNSDLEFVSGDCGACTLDIEFYDNNKRADISNLYAALKAKRADGVVLTQTGNITDNRAKIKLGSDVYAVPGELYLEVALLSSAKSYVTAKILIANVLEGAGEPSDVSLDNPSVFVTLLSEANEKLTQANDVLDEVNKTVSRVNNGFKVLDYFSSKEELEAAVTLPDAGDAYAVGTEHPYDIYIYSKTNGWVNNGHIQGAQGKSAYDIAVYEGFEGTEQEWLKSLKGDTGDEKILVQDGRIYVTENETSVELEQAFDVLPIEKGGTGADSVEGALEALGLNSASVKIATGSYTGTGTYGSGNRNSLTFDFEPKVVFVAPGNDGYAMQPLIRPYSRFCVLLYPEIGNTAVTSEKRGIVTWSGNTVSWYSLVDGGVYYQQNISGVIYHYIAIG